MKNRKGFTLIELLAVVTIMGILMVVAVGSVNRIIENTRRDTFASTAKEYIKSIRTAVTADNISCGGITASGTPDGIYYFTIDTTAQATKDLMETGGKSPFGNAEMKGYVKWEKKTDNSNPQNPKTTIKYTIQLKDTGGHGFENELAESDLRRSAIATNLAKTNKTGPGSGTLCTIN